MTQAIKYDGEKPDLSLVSKSLLWLSGAVLTFGVKKYARDNWRKGMDWSRCYAACLRHLSAWWDGENTDPESGLSHLGHAVCCLMFLIEYQLKGLGRDDRHKSDHEDETTGDVIYEQ